ncbi:hypothetical protein EV383_4386 [Pseudonocardia sediminis]|uniref:Uncharacterized protein n=1 Tax=Pseudonocardia sediminis TaxID=1397368 RepID=A0A4Q7UZA5_PSEST|nr:hypothetical protein EV383_4386 [Pseudonocardia sediminis]
MDGFRPNQRNVRALLKSRRIEQQALRPAAEKFAPILAGFTPKSNRAGGGGTARSTRVEGGHKSVTGDRVAVRVVQDSYSGRNRPRGGAAVPQDVGNSVTTERNYVAKALGAAKAT